jgi:ADP-ribose pyrophosphatase YjhB (NUDIX family)
MGENFYCKIDSGTMNKHEIETSKVCENKKDNTKHSFGVILCRVSPLTRRVEFAIVKKRTTYAFSLFAQCRYQKRNLPFLFNQMTSDELAVIKTLDFEKIWQKMWPDDSANGKSNPRLISRKIKFEKTFLKDGGGALKKLVSSSTGGGTDLWEVPKGRMDKHDENPLICAIRELEEEIGVHKSQYTVIPAQLASNYSSMGTRYCIHYFVALANPWLSRQKLCSKHVRGRLNNEICDVRWMDIEVSRYHNCHLGSVLSPVSRIIKKYNRGRFSIPRCVSASPP